MSDNNRMTKIAWIAVAVAASLWLTGCSSAPPSSVVKRVPAPVVSPPPAAQIAKAKVVPTPKVVEEPSPPEPMKTVRVAPAVEQAAVTVRPTPPAPAKALPPPPTAEDVLNLDPDALTDMLLTPHLKRQEPPAEVWQYVGQSCVLHVFFYPTSQGSRLSVDHLEATNSTGSKYPTNACLAELVSSGRTASP